MAIKEAALVAFVAVVTIFASSQALTCWSGSSLSACGTGGGNCTTCTNATTCRKETASVGGSTLYNYGCSTSSVPVPCTTILGFGTPCYCNSHDYCNGARTLSVSSFYSVLFAVGSLVMAWYCHH